MRTDSDFVIKKNMALNLDCVCIETNISIFIVYNFMCMILHVYLCQH